jgi:hypothetical protein
VATNNFFAALRDLPMANVDTCGEGNSTKTPGTNESTGEGLPPPSVLLLTSEVNLISLQRELRNAVSVESFRNIATGTLVIPKSVVD